MTDPRKVRDRRWSSLHLSLVKESHLQGDCFSSSVMRVKTNIERSEWPVYGSVADEWTSQLQHHVSLKEVL